jgi:hypothetical protein
MAFLRRIVSRKGAKLFHNSTFFLCGSASEIPIISGISPLFVPLHESPVFWIPLVGGILESGTAHGRNPEAGDPAHVQDPR